MVGEVFGGILRPLRSLLKDEASIPARSAIFQLRVPVIAMI